MEPPFYVKVSSLIVYDWDVIKQYIVILQLFHETTFKLEGKGKAECNGTIWEVFLCMKWLIKIFKKAKAQTDKVTIEDYSN